MTRTIKFRGKRVDNGEWVYGFYTRRYQILEGRVCDVIVHEQKGNDGGMYIVDPATVGQFTGLLDKNKVEIYEDDIVAIKFHGHYIERVYWKGSPDAIAAVFWDYSGFRLRAKGKEDARYADFWDEMRPHIVDMSLKHTEVIGNRTDTPELLK